jgi:hypothetical protein
MEFKKKYILLTLTLIMIGGCVPVNETIPETSIHTLQRETLPVPTMEAVLAPTIMTTLVERQTSPTNPPVRTATPTSAPDVTTSLTSTPIPALAPEVARQQLEDLIRNHDGCPLPCWWGLSPDISTEEDIKEFLAPYASILTFWGDGKGISFEVGQDNTIDFSIDYLTQANQNTIEALYIAARATSEKEDTYEDEFGSSVYNELLEEYSLPQVLTAYGVPSKVLINVIFLLYDGRKPLPDQQFGTLKARLLYPERGILVIYEMPLIKEGESGLGCPKDAFVSLWLTPPDNDSYYEKLLSSRQGEGKAFDEDKPIEESANMSPQAFYEEFRTPGNQCIRPPLALWPQPFIEE